jgi:deoxyribose-phosphate aldolase
MLHAGATRIGASASVKIVNELANDEHKDEQSAASATTGY